MYRTALRNVITWQQGAQFKANQSVRRLFHANGRSMTPILSAHKAKTLSMIIMGSTGVTCAFCTSTVPSKASPSWPKITLYQYDPCPYCCKVKAVLDYHEIPYHVVEVNPLTKKETKSFTDYKKVPILRIDDQIIVNSSTIIQHVRQLVEKREETEEEEKWCQWVDETLIVMMPPNIYRTIPEALQAFNYCLTQGNFTSLERQMSKYTGAFIMYLIAKRSKRKYQLEDERRSLYEALETWNKAIQDKKTPFLGGNEPNMADLSVFGVLRAIHGLDTFQDVMEHTSIHEWYHQMSIKVGSSTRQN